jgi:hypothetical protein
MAKKQGSEAAQVEKLFVKPAKGLVVPRPDNGRVLKEEGEWVKQSTYWRRRIADGDVLVDDKAVDKSESKPKKSEKSDKAGGQ